MFCHGDILSVGFSLKPSSLGTLLLHKIHSSLVGMALEQYCVIPNVTAYLCLSSKNRVLYSFCDVAVPSMACLQLFGERLCKTNSISVHYQ